MGQTGRLRVRGVRTVRRSTHPGRQRNLEGLERRVRRRAQARAGVPVRLLRQEEREPPRHHQEEGKRVASRTRSEILRRNFAGAWGILDGGARLRWTVDELSAVQYRSRTS